MLMGESHGRRQPASWFQLCRCGRNYSIHTGRPGPPHSMLRWAASCEFKICFIAHRDLTVDFVNLVLAFGGLCGAGNYGDTEGETVLPCCGTEER